MRHDFSSDLTKYSCPKQNASDLLPILFSLLNPFIGESEFFRQADHIYMGFEPIIVGSISIYIFSIKVPLSRGLFVLKLNYGRK